MNQTILEILGKLDHLNYLAQAKKNIQVIRLVVKEGQMLSQTERNAILEYLRSKLSQLTKVSDADPNDINFTIYIAVPENENLDKLKALREDFKKTP